MPVARGLILEFRSILQRIEMVGEKRPKFRGFHAERRANEIKLAGEFRLYCGAAVAKPRKVRFPNFRNANAEKLNARFF
jgi:hypothetical protein